MGKKNPVRCSSSTTSTTASISGSCFKSHQQQPASVNPVNTAAQSSHERFMEAFHTPKHIITPYIPEDGELMFETFTCVYSLFSLFLQYIHVYRTVWWLPHSYSNFALNFHLVDYKVLSFLVVMLVRRLAWSFVKYVSMTLSPSKILPKVFQISKSLFIANFVGVQLWLLFVIGLVDPMISLLCFCYPLYLILFGFKFGPLFEILPEYTGPHIHHCNGNGKEVRDEVFQLKCDFNHRLKRVLFQALTAAYYAALVPCSFVQSTTVYDINWATQHFFLVWLGHFTLFVAYVYPPRYCDVLHRAALHLGQWTMIEAPSDVKSCVDWNEEMVAQRGAIVRHKDNVYVACGINTAAEPGSTSHVRFHLLFATPALAQCLLLAVQVFLVVLQLVLLLRCSEWQHIISCSVLLSLNYYVLYKVVRDYLVLWRVYRAEEIMQQPRNTGTFIR